MVVEAVASLDDKVGSSLQAIRKYMQNNFLVKKSVASFNNLSMKAILKAVDDNQLEAVHKNCYKLTVVEKDRRRRALDQYNWKKESKKETYDMPNSACAVFMYSSL